jgi:hypothetical protein
MSYHTAIRTKSVSGQRTKMSADKTNLEANDRKIEKQQLTYAYSVLAN